MEQHFEGTDAAYERLQAAIPPTSNPGDLLAESREFFRRFEAGRWSPPKVSSIFRRRCHSLLTLLRIPSLLH